MHKKGQITYFILFGFIILIATSLVFYIYSQNKNENLGGASFDRQPIELFIKSCIKQTGEDALQFISQHGGYYELPNLHYDSFLLSVPYYFYNNFPLNPTKEQVEKQISDYINDNIFFCFQNFAIFKQQGYDINFFNISTKTTLIPDKAIYDVKIHLVIKKGTASYNLDSFKMELDKIGLNEIIELNNLMLQEQAKEPSFICISCIINWTIDYGLLVRLDNLGDNEVLFTVIDNKTVIKGRPLEFNFINRYDLFSCSNLPVDDIEFVQDCVNQIILNLTQELRINEVPDFELKLGDIFFYDVNATIKNVIFEDYANLFDIQESSGIINFTPDESQTGYHDIWIKVTDSLGRTHLTNFRLRIIK